VHGLDFAVVLDLLFDDGRGTLMEMTRMAIRNMTATSM